MKITRYDMWRTLRCIVICMFLMMSLFTQVSAARCVFSLSHEKVRCGRLFTVSLECEGHSEIAAFVAQLDYDETALEYRSAAVSDEKSQCSVNAAEAGTLRLVYLCEDGADCTEKTSLIEFTFKAVSNGDSSIRLSVSQVIDVASDGIDAAVSETSLVQVFGSSIDQNNSQREPYTDNEKVEKTDTYDEKESSAYKNDSDIKYHTKVEGTEGDVILITSSVVGVIVLVCLVGFCAYKFGMKSAFKKETQNIPTEHSSE